MSSFDFHDLIIQKTGGVKQSRPREGTSNSHLLCSAAESVLCSSGAQLQPDMLSSAQNLISKPCVLVKSTMTASTLAHYVSPNLWQSLRVCVLVIFMQFSTNEADGYVVVSAGCG